ncbi:VanZ family protein [Gleimia hominis]|uniref:VanZ family protein n=1 Tax=Gleimia hominis TaxID=595468 RepID=UPI000C806587|nr:VanZ family protein [Gleimia hominis]WIK65225.1 VanZ family protein [Gleimia hominis]
MERSKPWLVCALILLGGQVWLLYSPAGAPSTEGLAALLRQVLTPLPGPSAPGEPGFDKVAHATSFAAVTAALLLAHLPSRWVVGFSVVHAITSEIVQALLIPGRDGDPVDALFDLGGILFAWAVITWWKNRIGKEPDAAGTR